MTSLLLGVLFLLSAAALAGTAFALVACLQLSSPAEALLAASVLAWGEIVGLLLVLSAVGAATRWATVAGIAGVAVAAGIVWSARGRPRLPPLRPAVAGLRVAAGDRLVGVTAIAFCLVLAYCGALAVLTPANEGDTLAYHLARALFWAQDGAVGYVPNPTDGRLGPNPPNAEIGQLFTVLLAGSDRFVAVTQLVAFPVCVVAVYATARRALFPAREALYGALLFGLLPVVALQSSTALNDLVAASFVVAAAPFALAPGRRAHVVAGLAVALGVGTKSIVPLLVVPLAAVVLASHPLRRGISVVGALLLGVIAGSYWSLENLHVTGQLDGGLSEGQMGRHSLEEVLTMLGRLARRSLDVPGSDGEMWVYWLVAGGLAVAALIAWLRGRRTVMWSVLGAALVVGIAPLVVDALGALAGTEVERRTADATSSWYGPAGVVAVIGATAIGAAHLRSRKGSLRTVLLAAAPLILLVLLALTLTYDPFRGRFLMPGMALSAATWGVLLARRWLGLGTAALAIVTVFLSLQTFDAKPSGLGLGNYMRPAPWGQPLWSVQTILRPDGNERAILRFFEHHVPTEATVALALKPNDLISPYFGPHATRTVSLVPEGYAAPTTAEWFVIAPERKVDLCLVDWRQRFALRSGWRVLRRVGTDGCQP